MSTNSRLSFLPFLLIISILVFHPHSGDCQTKPVVGLRNNTPQVHALINARIVTAPGAVIERGTVVLRDGIIVGVGPNITPPDARVWDCTGLTIYPGLIDAYSMLGAAKKADKSGKDDAQNAKPVYWNQFVRANENALELLEISKDAVTKLRAEGFTAALLVPQSGILRGTSALINLSDDDIHERVLREQVTQNVAFETSGSRGVYPTSLMGAIALVRQSLLDADWYGRAQSAYAGNVRNQIKPEENLTLASLSAALASNMPFVFETRTEHNYFQALKIAQEFNLNIWIRGSGFEYRILDQIAGQQIPLILSLNFPKAPKVDSPEEALDVTLQQLSHWEMSPANPALLNQKKIAFAFSTSELEKPAQFTTNVRKAIENGLSPEDALAAVTLTPATLLGVDKQLGSIEAGKLAHLVVTDGDLFAEKTQIVDVWIDGERFEINPRPEVDPRGAWELKLALPDGQALRANLEISGKPEKLSGKVVKDTVSIKLKSAELDHQRLTIIFEGEKLGLAGVVRASGRVEDKHLTGSGETPTGRPFTWEASLKDASKADSTKSTRMESSPPPKFAALSPPGAFGFARSPEQPEAVLVQHATIWTSGPDGILQDASLLIKEGKITAIGQNVKKPGGALVIDGTGKHVTPGLIDAHSHSGVLGSVNEVGQTVSAEVRISDVIDSYDIALYRELAGGLTVANQLHGSANPIGGQNSVIKLKWGRPASELTFEEAMPGIKFALGENVKQSNWGDKFTTRYPQTRMGVEQLIRDRFKAALDYEKEWQKYNSLRTRDYVVPPRRDLELETLLEILHGKRLVHAHSYRQDEILMLVRVAEDFGFQIGVFQHVLEGYKVADVLAQHGAGASTFSDWWGYKYEVTDAIPYNGALMHNAGVVVSFNSDSDELARRLNWEAAKAVKYGGVSQEEALKFVTLNPAKQLRIDDQVGSLEVGKDGDFVIWNGSPLSTYSRCEQTWIDGHKYFDLEKDQQMQQQIIAERARIIQKILKEGEDEKKKPAEEKADSEKKVEPEHSVW